MATNAGVSIRNVTKRFGSTVAVNDVSIEIPPGAFMTLLGPSGCGKTTLLRIIAGLENADSGRIQVGADVLYDEAEGINISPRRRGIGLVFQSYALWPHMTVRANVDYGLRIKGMSNEEMDAKVAEVLRTVGMQGYEERYPNELSGGQQQRVSMARMLVMEPSVLLMDEPLSNLDAKLRLSLRAELKRIHEMIGITVIYVTHDQTEAMTLSTEIAVMESGVVQQRDIPYNVYNNSANLFVAEFMGSPATNRISGTAQLSDHEANVAVFNGTGSIPLPESVRPYLEDGRAIEFCIRPEQIHLSKEPRPNFVPLQVYTTLDSGPDTHMYLESESGERIIARDEERLDVAINETVHVGFPADAIRLYDPHSTELIGSEYYVGRREHATAVERVENE